uniref:Uncharacterized protein AlNc14C39G3397 n=2 Tax=Albugo laibachii Nc14 TaxID=890382 RepID=F0W9D6_9STRA|nr:conserved hypothetical protein [Albugo laibachii Nc14]|eukprot:CCA17749.1 conserved hypothetical protein [Albugo laibachii Nc14]
MSKIRTFKKKSCVLSSIWSETFHPYQEHSLSSLRKSQNANNSIPISWEYDWNVSDVSLHQTAKKTSTLKLSSIESSYFSVYAQLERWKRRNQLRIAGAFLKRSSKNWTNRLQIHISPWNVTLWLENKAPDGEKASSNHLRIGMKSIDGYQETFVQLPCALDDEHVVDLFWDGEHWIRWFVDDILLHETFLPDITHLKSQSSDMHPSLNLTFQMESLSSKQKQIRSPVLEIVSLELMSAMKDSEICPLSWQLFITSKNATIESCKWFRLSEQPERLSAQKGSIKGSFSYKELQGFLTNTERTYPNWSRLHEIGKSFEGRPLQALCLGRSCLKKGLNHEVPQSLFTGMHHSREALVYTIDVLLQDVDKHRNIEALALLSSRELWFIPLVNPDGYVKNARYRPWEGSHSGYRKNTNPHMCPSKEEQGVDLNRNYDVCYTEDTVGSSTDPCQEDFRGTRPFSEPETIAIKLLVERNKYQTALHYHAFGRYFNLPFACKDLRKPPEKQAIVFESMAREMVRYNQFGFGRSWEESNLYSVNGETSDWMWNVHGIYSMSPEVGPLFEVENGFWPPAEDVIPLSAELHYSNLYAARVSGNVFSVSMQNVVSKTVDKRNFLELVIQLTNAGLGQSNASRVDTSPIHVVASMDWQGLANKSSETRTFQANLLGNIVDPLTLNIHNIVLPFADTNMSSQALYVMIKESLSCQLFRISLGLKSDQVVTSQMWEPVSLPRCQFCESFGNKSFLSDSYDPQDICTDIDGLTAVLSQTTKQKGIRIDHSASTDGIVLNLKNYSQGFNETDSTGSNGALMSLSLVVMIPIISCLGLLFLRLCRVRRKPHYQSVSSSRSSPRAEDEEHTGHISRQDAFLNKEDHTSLGIDKEGNTELPSPAWNRFKKSRSKYSSVPTASEQPDIFANEKGGEVSV